MFYFVSCFDRHSWRGDITDAVCHFESLKEIYFTKLVLVDCVLSEQGPNNTKNSNTCDHDPRHLSNTLENPSPHPNQWTCPFVCRRIKRYPRDLKSIKRIVVHSKFCWTIELSWGDGGKSIIRSVYSSIHRSRDRYWNHEYWSVNWKHINRIESINQWIDDSQMQKIDQFIERPNNQRNDQSIVQQIEESSNEFIHKSIRRSNPTSK